MTERGFIDVNVQLGPLAGGARGAPLETVVRERDGHGVGRSLVRHRTALLGEAELGNRLLLDEVGGDAGFIPVGVLSVDRADVVDAAAPFAGQVAAFWLEGRAAPGSGLSAEPLVRAAGRTGRPLIVPIAGWGSAASIGAATEGLGVPVLLTGSHYTTSVDDVAAGRRYEHLLFDTSSMAHFRAIETFVAAIGGERVLFGSGSPFRAIQSSINAILVADITDDQKRAILAGNAARIFGLPAGEVELPALVRPPRAFDTHTHGGPMP